MNELAPAAAMGAAAGLRSFTSPAALSRAAVAGLLKIEGRPLAVFRSRRGSKVLMALAIAELVGDKLPFMPSRLARPGLAGRLISGAICGAAINSSRGRSVLRGALAGSAAAVGATLAGYHLRQALVKRYDIPDRTVALAEDAIALGTAFVTAALLKPATDERVPRDSQQDRQAAGGSPCRAR
ncbi:MAG: hypothetical protein JWO80_3190 [Bryobacterales bacterium]|nr:hypothetical protein [Bryobacterales bacterium]